MSLRVFWTDERLQPKTPPNPLYPNGVDIDRTRAGEKTCFTDLPYPAKQCGQYRVVCDQCGIFVVLAATGQSDDPRSVRLPCGPIDQELLVEDGPKPSIGDLELDGELYLCLVRPRLKLRQSYKHMLQLQVPKLRKFGKTHFVRVITLLRKAGVPGEEIVGSPLWTTAPVEWQACPRGLRKESLWPASQPEEPPAPVAVAVDERILERTVSEVGQMNRADFASLILGLWKSGVPFEKTIKPSPLWTSAPTTWRNRAFSLLRKESNARRQAREDRRIAEK